jgi:ATP-dependent DNA helicase RecG
MGGSIIAPQDIWDSLGIVDTEHYRKLIESLQRPGILQSEIRREDAQRKARMRGTSARKIPRFKINPKQQELPKQPSGKSSKEEDDAIKDSPDPRAKLWLENLPYEIEETALVEFLSPLAEVQNIQIPRDWTTRKSKGYAFVEFDSLITAERMMSELNGLSFGGRDIIARRATPRGK